MKPRIRTSLSLLLISCIGAIVLNGCYSLRQIDNPKEGAGEELEIHTTSGRQFSFHSWRIDSLGTVFGIARFADDRQSGHADSLLVADNSRSSARVDEPEAFVAIPSKDIYQIRAKQLDTGKTIVLGAAAGITAYGIIYLINVVRAYEEAGRAASPKVGDLTIGF